jgi:predicted nucleic acid-binding protein
VTRTFIDSGILVSAARGTDLYSERALTILEDESREFASSIFVRLEVLPKAICYKKNDEVEFYQSFFDSVQYWANDLERLIQDGYNLGSRYGLSALDPLHVAAALLMGAEELVTTERRTKPMHRVSNIKVTSIQDD